MVTIGIDIASNRYTNVSQRFILSFTHPAREYFDLLQSMAYISVRIPYLGFPTLDSFYRI